MGATIKDVARRAGVSLGTVSNVLNGKRGEFTAETYARVMEAVQVLRYHPNRVARSLVQRSSRVLGVNFVEQERPLGDNPYLAGVVDGLVLAAREECYNLTLYTCQSPGDESGVSTFLDRSIDGLFLAHPEATSRLPRRLAETDLPFVVIGSERPEPGVNWIDVDNRRGAELAMMHLLAHGHRRIAHLAGTPAQSCARHRAAVYRDLLAAHGLPRPPQWLAWCDFAMEPARQAAGRMLAADDPPSAIFAANDEMALGALEAARDLGIAVPGRLSVIGFDDVREARRVDPPLTTVRQPVREIGYEAARWLIDHLQGRERAPLARRVTPLLVERGTVGLPSG